MPHPFPLDDVYLDHLRQQRKHQQLGHLSCLIGLTRQRGWAAVGFALIYAAIGGCLTAGHALPLLCGMAWGIAGWNCLTACDAWRSVRRTTRHRDALLAKEEG